MADPLLERSLTISEQQSGDLKMTKLALVLTPYVSMAVISLTFLRHLRQFTPPPQEKEKEVHYRLICIHVLKNYKLTFIPNHQNAVKTLSAHYRVQ